MSQKTMEVKSNVKCKNTNMSKCKQPEEAKSSHDVDHRVLQVKFTFYDNITWILYLFFNLFLTSSSLDDDDKLDTECFVQSSSALL